MLWRKSIKESEAEAKRAFAIWRDALNSYKRKQAKVKKLIWLRYFKTLNLALN